MHKYAFFLVILFASSSGQTPSNKPIVLFDSSSGPTPNSKPIEPDVLGVVFLLDSSNHVLQPLSNERWKAQGKRSGWFSAAGFIEIAGEHPEVRVASSRKIELIFNVSHPEDVKLYQSLQKKDQRLFEMVKVGPGGRTREPIPGLPVVLTKYGQSSFKLVPMSPLVPGEYAVIYDGTVMSFGIDN